MAEYIERESTIELYCQKCEGYYDGHCIHRGECDVDVIQTAPAADVQPVVYCKNCIYARKQNGNKIFCEYFGCGALEQDGFCSNAVQV